MPAGAWPVASTMTSIPGLAIIAMVSSRNRVAPIRASSHPTRRHASRARSGDRSAIAATSMPGVVGTWLRNMEPNFPAPIRPTRTGRPSSMRLLSSRCRFIRPLPSIPAGLVPPCPRTRPEAKRMAEEFEWRKLRADQLRERARRDAIVILPVASLEQHGPHLPVEVDSRLGEAVAARAAAKVQEKGQPVLVLPVLWTGLSEHHMSFGGTITLDFPAFSALVEGVVRSVLRHGFRRIVLLNAHGGNENALRTICDELTPKLRAPIVQFTYWYAAAVPIAKILETQGGLSHACEAETSMMMRERPELVAADRIPLAKSNITTADIADAVGGGVYRWRSIGSRSSSGVIGNPEAASAEKGERLFEAIATALADKLCNPALWDLPWDAERVRD